MKARLEAMDVAIVTLAVSQLLAGYGLGAASSYLPLAPRVALAVAGFVLVAGSIASVHLYGRVLRRHGEL